MGYFLGSQELEAKRCVMLVYDGLKKRLWVWMLEEIVGLGTKSGKYSNALDNHFIRDVLGVSHEWIGAMTHIKRGIRLILALASFPKGRGQGIGATTDLVT